MATGIDMRRALPFGLKRYRGKKFAELHDCGSGVITASLVPALFGESRFAGRFAALAHIAGVSALPDFGKQELMERGQEFEEIVIRRVEREHGWKCQHARAWAAHDRIPRLVASPDVVAWRDDKVPGIGEIKTVAEQIYQGKGRRPDGAEDRGWLDGPPLEVHLQHQIQFACTGATWGFIACQIVGGWRWETQIWPTQPEPDVIATIESEIEQTLADLDAGELGEPDTHETSLAAAQNMWHPIPGKTLQLNDPEYDEIFDRWIAEKEIAAGAQQKAKGYRSRFAAMAKDNDEIRTPGGRVIRISRVRREASMVPERTYTKVEPVLPKEDWVEV